ncbi:UDP-4-amino-4,6-dideoxy-N-acetyl-beta-L-altrosamine transaminase [Rheinheimera baltica]|uniref:UDP-4-amino-4, 6-dideoxy-N-acetyl-beta-L-altrosamine transaminase n=1 Tax=Rheinheimera baltica TaxID=67576 RepID=A0ABT9HUR6_9GAMM|nr:UDP-4-amino-4,6-dideoxy-N-acetyl-beta-L-altrosamine transaminase [Rheinheimera baltica]MDP5134861.1 UDP-4-amino-4,6-dideoxy-N-acetyl-beta-L-altrosamine transaminase [Rheinheimera baltica]MDP5143177.1 UDP-4-amino-4,6-dideoxy-N-acetyl-beta-L-altrosamine transaminase [Rheinheimera baltica]
MIPYGRQHITQADIDAVTEVLQSDFLTQGPAVPAFEKRLAEFTGAQHAIAVNSATSALHIACLALGVGIGSKVWTSPISFVASANCARYCGADIHFVDIDENTGNMAIDKLRKKLEHARHHDTLPNVVIPVHLSGASCDMAQIRFLASEFGFSIIEDASHAIGARYQDETVGNCRYSDITVFSFHPVKIITTAEGGMAMTNNTALADKMRLLRSHGISRDNKLMTEPSHGDWYYQQLQLGFNYRMTDIQAALGLSQSMRLVQMVQKRQLLAANYHQLLAHLPLRLPALDDENLSSWHLFIIRLNDKSKRKLVFDALRAAGIGVNVHYIPIHTQPYYQQLGFDWGDFPAAEDFYERIISLPMFPELSSEQQQYVADILQQALLT